MTDDIATDGPNGAALVGVAGGAGATRLTLEVGAVLARDGRRVAAFDAAFATQGMADHLAGRIDPGLTDLVTDESVTPAAAMTELPVEADGELHCCPVRAPFGDLARAKTPEAARRLEAAIEEAGEAFDHVLVDVPPVATNPAVGAVTAVDRVALVAPPSPRGADAVQRLRGRLSDVGAPPDLVVANRGTPAAFDPDLSVPEGPSEGPVAGEATGEFPAAVADLAGRLFDLEMTVESDSDGLLDDVL